MTNVKPRRYLAYQKKLVKKRWVFVKMDDAVYRTKEAIHHISQLHEVHMTEDWLWTLWYPILDVPVPDKFFPIPIDEVSDG
jgi:hypothetical protein